MSISISELLRIPVILGFDLASNGRTIVYSSNEGGIPQLYALPAKVGHKARRITKESEPVMFGFLSPEGDKLVYLVDKDGNEIHHLFLVSLEGEHVRRITKTPYRTFEVSWHPDGKEITRAFASMTSCGLETFDLENDESYLLKEMPPVLNLRYSHNGKWIACTIMGRDRTEKIVILNRNDPTDAITYGPAGQVRESNPVWSPDDARIAFATNLNGKGQIAIRSLQGEETTLLELPEDEEIPEDQAAVWDSEGKSIYYVASKYGRTTVFHHYFDGKQRESLPFPRGTIRAIKMSDDNAIMVALHDSMTSPSGIYLHKIGSSCSHRITSDKYKVDMSKLVDPQSIWFESFDGRKIHGWYLTARSEPDPNLGLLWVHGGPWVQVSDGWFTGAFLHCLSQSGFSVLAPNYRGSTGYGAEFQNLSIGDPGGADLEDLVYAAKWLHMQQKIDKTKISIIGASYGGYLTLMALTKKPETFAAGVSIVPAISGLEMYALLDPLSKKEVEKMMGGSPTEKEELYRDRSPFTHISKIRAPVMIIAGGKDARCPIEIIKKFSDKLRELNHPHTLVVMEKAGHISTRTQSEQNIENFTRIIDFLKRAAA